MGESNLNVALNTPVEELTEEQKQLIRDNEAALTDEDKARFVEAGVIPATPSSEGGEAGDSATPPTE